MAAASLDSLQANIFVANLDFEIVYVNDCAKQTLSQIAGEIRQASAWKLTILLGSSILTFYKDAARVEKILSNPQALPHQTEFNFGPITFRRVSTACSQQMAKCRGTLSPGTISLTGCGWSSITPGRSQPSALASGDRVRVGRHDH